MNPLTITKKSLPKDDLVIISRKEYQRMLAVYQHTVELDKDIKESLRQFKAGKAIGPFDTVDEMIKSLES